jgi:hypothetical protein
LIVPLAASISFLLAFGFVAAKILAKPNLTIGDAAIYCAPVVPDTVIV